MTTRGFPARFLAGFRRHSYLGAGILGFALGCGRPGAVVPEGAFLPSSRGDFLAAAAATVPSERQIIRLSWHSDDGQVQYTGSGAARIAPPDSLRVDISGALGLGRATLILTGDSVIARPVSVVDKVLPDRFALWAVLGVLKLPPDEVRIERADAGARGLWRTTDGSGRMTVFELSNGALASVTRQEAGRITSQLKLLRGPDGAVSRASLVDMQRNLRLEVAITGRQASNGFPPEVWRLGP